MSVYIFELSFQSAVNKRNVYRGGPVLKYNLHGFLLWRCTVR